MPISIEKQNARRFLLLKHGLPLWDKQLIRALFDFSYRWEIYTPAEKWKYGAYVLPTVYGERFAGRIELIVRAKERLLTVRQLWLEEGFQRTKSFDRALGRTIRRFAAFSSCQLAPPGLTLAGNGELFVD